MAKKTGERQNTVSIPVRSTNQTHVNSGFDSFNKKSRANSRAKLLQGHSLEGLKQNFKYMITPIHLPYKKAVLKTYPNDWYFEFYYLQPGTIDNFKRFKQRFDINRIRNKEGEAVARMYGKIGVDYLNQLLSSGWNPFESKHNSTILTINEQLTNVKNKLLVNASKDKQDSFNTHLNRLNTFMQVSSITYLQMMYFNDHHADAYKMYMLSQLKLSKKTINESISYCSRIWKQAIKIGYAVTNPFERVDRVTDNEVVKKETEIYEPFTGSELEKIFEHLKAVGEINFIYFLATIYYGWARPKEIARLRISNIDLKSDNPCIRFKGIGTKNKRSATIQIVPPLKKIFESMDLEKYPSNYYLFSGDNDGFLPGEKMLTKHRALMRWRKHVKDNLSIQKEMYGLKHTGNIDYLMKNKGNIDLKWQQMQNRHSSSSMTDRYNRKLGAYFIEVGEINFSILNPA